MNRLHLGCGDLAPDGWLNTDGSWHATFAKIPLFRAILGRMGAFSISHDHWSAHIRRVDLRKLLPFDNERFDVIYSSHVLEHLHRDEALSLLRECHRCCRVGGIVRMAVPNLERYINDYVSGVVTRRSPSSCAADSFVQRLLMRPATAHRPKTLLHAIYEARTDFNSHKWLYDEASLSHLYREAGFPHPYRCEALESASDHIVEVERPERLGGDQTLIIEARREA